MTAGQQAERGRGRGTTPRGPRSCALCGDGSAEADGKRGGPTARTRSQVDAGEEVGAEGLVVSEVSADSLEPKDVDGLEVVELSEFDLEAQRPALRLHGPERHGLESDPVLG